MYQCRAKLLGNTEADWANKILKNATIAVPLKHLSNFWRSLEMSLINCKIELKLKWTKYCVLSAAAANSNDANSNNIIFTIKDTKLYFPIVTLSTKDDKKLSKHLNNKKLWKRLSKGFERSAYWNENKTKSENKNAKNE